MNLKPNQTENRNPYTILNIPPSTTSQEEIQKAYKYGSRYFHPDKIRQRQQNPNEELTKEIFIEFKNAYDILSNPISKLIYDTYGYDGIELFKSAEYRGMYTQLQTLYKNECDGKVLQELLRTIILEHNYEDYCKQNVSLNGALDMKFTLGDTSIHHDKNEMSLNVNVPLQHNSFVKIGYNTTMSYAHTGKSNVDIVYGMEVLPYTDMTMGLSIDNNSCELLNTYPTPTISTSRMLHDNTSITIQSQLHINPNNQSLITPIISIFSQRIIFKQILADIGLGFGILRNKDHNLQFQFMKIGVKSLLPKHTQVSCTFNAGVYPLPITFSIKHYLSSEEEDDDESLVHFNLHTNLVNAIAFDGYIKRQVDNHVFTKFPIHFQIGVRQTYAGTVQIIFKIFKNNSVISIPITLFSIYTSQYLFKLSYLTFMAFLVDQSVQDVLQSINNKNDIRKMLKKEHDDELDKKKDNHQDTLLQSMKSRGFVKEQQAFMSKIAFKKQVYEKNINGLVILKATYYAIHKITHGRMNSLDVTTPMQFFVKHSKLNLPSGTKSNLMGFYDITTDIMEEKESHESLLHHYWNKWHNKIFGTQKDDYYNVFLNIRYVYSGNVYEVLKADEEEISLPFCYDALLLGRENVVC